MSKKTLSIISICILLVGFYFIFKEFSLPRFVSGKLTEMMKVYVSLGDLDLNFDNIEAEELKIMNPKGFRLPVAMTINKISLSTPFTAFFKDEVVIDELVLSDLYVGVEFENQNSKKGNWTVIMHNLNESGRGAEKKSEKHVLIKKCTLTNLKVEQAYSTGNPPAKFYPTIARLELKNIDSRNGIPLQQISQAILQATLEQIFSEEGLKNMLENYLNNKPPLPFNIPFLQ